MIKIIFLALVSIWSVVGSFYFVRKWFKDELVMFIFVAIPLCNTAFSILAIADLWAEYKYNNKGIKDFVNELIKMDEN